MENMVIMIHFYSESRYHLFVSLLHFGGQSTDPHQLWPACTSSVNIEENGQMTDEFVFAGGMQLIGCFVANMLFWAYLVQLGAPAHLTEEFQIQSVLSCAASTLYRLHI